MSALRRIGVVLVLATVLGGSQGSAQGEIEMERDSRDIELVDETGSSRQAEGIADVFRWSIGRFEQRGLDVYADTVTFHRDRARCFGREGWWSAGGGHSRIDICVGGSKQRAQTLLHEMGHDWIAHNLDQAERDAFLARLGLAVWTGSDVEWADRGIEQAAMIIAWGLAEQCEKPTTLGALDQTTIADEFRRLTNKTPLCISP